MTALNFNMNSFLYSNFQRESFSKQKSNGLSTKNIRSSETDRVLLSGRVLFGPFQITHDQAYSVTQVYKTLPKRLNNLISLKRILEKVKRVTGILIISLVGYLFAHVEEIAHKTCMKLLRF